MNGAPLLVANTIRETMRNETAAMKDEVCARHLLRACVYMCVCVSEGVCMCACMLL